MTDDRRRGCRKRDSEANGSAEITGVVAFSPGATAKYIVGFGLPQDLSV